MADDAGKWAVMLQWIVANPEKLALMLVLLTGAWRWIREAVHEARGATQEETLLETLLKERKVLWEENQSLRDELRQERNKNGNGRVNPSGLESGEND